MTCYFPNFCSYFPITDKVRWNFSLSHIQFDFIYSNQVSLSLWFSSVIDKSVHQFGQVFCVHNNSCIYIRDGNIKD